MSYALTYQTVFSILIFSAVTTAIIGGVVFALWPRPSRVRRYQVMGVALGMLSVLLGSEGAYMGYALADQDAHMGFLFYAIMALGSSAFLWFIAARITDYCTGGHLLGEAMLSIRVNGAAQNVLPPNERPAKSGAERNIRA